MNTRKNDNSFLRKKQLYFLENPNTDLGYPEHSVGVRHKNLKAHANKALEDFQSANLTDFNGNFSRSFVLQSRIKSMKDASVT